MMRLTLALVSTCMIAASTGCSMCCAPFDAAFGAYGGVIERDDMYSGRVGSVFDPAGAQHVDYEQMSDSSVIEPDTGFESLPMEEVPGVLEDDLSGAFEEGTE